MPPAFIPLLAKKKPLHSGAAFAVSMADSLLPFIFQLFYRPKTELVA